MFKLLKRYRVILLIAGFILLPVFFFYIQKKIPAARASSTAVLLDTFFFLQKPVLAIGESFNDFYYRYWSSINSYDELILLRKKVNEIQNLQIALTESESENQRLRKLLNFSQTIEGPRLVAATITGRTGTPLARTFQIDKGSRDGLNRGDAVISSQGALGQILALGKYSSKVLLITDQSSAIDVIVERSRAHGIMRGVNNSHRYSLKVKDFDRLHDIEVGDIIVTSGVGAKFPTGIPIGEVLKIRFNQEGIYVEADIKPYTTFDRIEEVLVLTQSDLNTPWRRKEMIQHWMQDSSSQNHAKGK